MYLFGYQIKFKNVENQTVLVNIYDTNSGEGTTVFTQLQGAKDPCHIFIVDNNEEKFTPIRAKQAEIKFNSTRDTNLSTFIAAEDNRWYVEILVGGNVKFKGYLILDDIDEDFLDPAASNVVTLIATDNIGLLKDEPLTNFLNANPRGYFSLIQFAAWCFSKTNLNLSINLCHNLQEDHSSDPMYQSCFIHSKTFERDINESINCYDVLEYLLGNDSFATQANGEWWIVRIDELSNSAGQNNRYDYEGKFIESVSFDTTLSIDPYLEEIYFTNKATFVKAQQPVKNVALTYTYEYPKEIIDNIDFSRQATNPIFTQNFTEDSIAKVRKRYRLDDWKLKAGTENNPSNPTTTAYVERIFQNDYEKERYAVIEKPAAVQPVNFLETNEIPMMKGDKFSFSVDFAYTTNISGNNIQIEVQLLLYGEDNSKWVFGNNPSGSFDYRWAQYVENTSTGDLKIRTSFNRDNLDEREWQTISADSGPLPVNGSLVIRLFQSFYSNIKYQNVRFDYIPYINGSYAKYRSQQHIISQALITKKVVEESVKISDSPKPLFKGALFYADDTTIVTTSATFGTLAGVGIIFIPGIDRRALFGEYVKVSGTSDNNGIYRITNKYYNPVDSITVLTVAETLTTETVSTTFSTVKFRLADTFIDGLNPGAEIPFGYHQALGVWNQYNRPFILFDFQLQGLNGSSTFPDIIHKWEVAEDTKYSNNKLFMMLHYDQDLHLCEWKGVMMEFLDTTIDKDYDSDYSFKYITE